MGHTESLYRRRLGWSQHASLHTDGETWCPTVFEEALCRHYEAFQGHLVRSCGSEAGSDLGRASSTGFEEWALTPRLRGPLKGAIQKDEGRGHPLSKDLSHYRGWTHGNKSLLWGRWPLKGL